MRGIGPLCKGDYQMNIVSHPSLSWTWEFFENKETSRKKFSPALEETNAVPFLLSRERSRNFPRNQRPAAFNETLD